MLFGNAANFALLYAPEITHMSDVSTNFDVVSFLSKWKYFTTLVNLGSMLLQYMLF